MNRKIQIWTVFIFLVLFMSTCGYSMLNVLLRYFFIAIQFIIYLHKGLCYSILLFQEDLLEYLGLLSLTAMDYLGSPCVNSFPVSV